jgi:hypothetical protein
MSPSDVDGFDMHGDLDPDDPTLAAFRDELRALGDGPAPPMNQELAQFVAGLSPGPISVLPEPSRKKRPMILQTLTAKLVAGGVAAFATMSGLAVAGALPDPVQSAVSSAGDSMGFDLPNPEKHEAIILTVESTSTTTEEAEATHESTTTRAPEPATTASAAVVEAETTTSRQEEPTSTTAPKAECSDEWTQTTNTNAEEHRSETGATNIEHRDGACEERRTEPNGDDANGDDRHESTEPGSEDGEGHEGDDENTESTPTTRHETTTTREHHEGDGEHHSGSEAGSGERTTTTPTTRRG